MTMLQSIEGKFYEIPEDQAASFEIPRDKMKELLGKTGKSLAPKVGAEPAPAQRGAPAAMPGGSPVVVQIFPNGMQGPMAGPAGAAPSAPGEGENEGDVEPYMWWQNFRNPYTGWWLNRWWY